MDKVSKEKRSSIMSKVHSLDTKPEKIVRQFLFSKGFRYRKNDTRLPGKPDIVLPKYNAVIFVNGCFWHHHNGCKRATLPKANKEYWNNKIQKNIERDMSVQRQLQSMGWNVFVVWECEISNNEKREKRLGLLVDQLYAVKK